MFILSRSYCMLSKDVAFVRFYYEGMTEVSGNMSKTIELELQ